MMLGLNNVLLIKTFTTTKAANGRYYTICK